MKKRLLLALIAVMSVFALSGCAKINIDFTVEENGDVYMDTEILVSTSLMGLASYASESAPDASTSGPSAQEIEEMVASLQEGIDGLYGDSAHEIEVVANEAYIGVRATSTEPLAPATLGNMTVTVNGDNIHLELGDAFSSLGGDESNTALSSDDAAMLKALGAEMNISILMPYPIVSGAEAGTLSHAARMLKVDMMTETAFDAAVVVDAQKGASPADVYRSIAPVAAPAQGTQPTSGGLSALLGRGE